MLEIKRNTTIIASSHDFTYSGQFMGERKITATVESLTSIQFAEGDKCEYRGESYYLINEPTENQAYNKQVLTYTLTLTHEQYQFGRLLFKDVVPNNPSNEYYNNNTSSVTFIGNVNNLIGRIMENMDRSYAGWGYVVSDDVFLEEKQVTLIDGTCEDALKLINSLFELEYWIRNKTIHIGGTATQIGGNFEYGQGKGIYDITRTSESKKIITRLSINSSDRNIPSDYRVTAEDKYNPQLMLPYVTAKTNYIDSTNIDLNNIKEGVLENKDIFPSIEDGSGINEIVSVQAIEDDDAGFTIEIKNLGFSIEDQIIAGKTAVMAMTSGYLSGYEFDIHSINGNNITLVRNTEIENNPLPNNITAVRSGDRFVLLNILMPQKYIDIAEQRLLQWGQDQFSKNGIDKDTVTYAIKLAEEQIARGVIGHGKTLGHESKTLGASTKTLGIKGEKAVVEAEILEGNTMRVIDRKNLVDEILPIQQLTISHKAGQILPVYDVNVSKSIISSRFVDLEKAQYATEQTLAERIQAQEQENRKKTKEIKQGNFIETRYAVNGSYLVHPTLVISERNPSGWALTPPTAGTLETIWTIESEISGVTGRLVTGEWTILGSVKGTNIGGVSSENKGVWDNATLYSGTATTIDIVDYSGSKYYTRVDAGAIPTGALPTDTAYWNPFEVNHGSMATDLFFAELAYVENLGVKNLKTAESGERMEVTELANALKFLLADESLALEIGGDIYGSGQKGLRITNGVVNVDHDGSNVGVVSMDNNGISGYVNRFYSVDPNDLPSHVTLFAPCLYYNGVTKKLVFRDGDDVDHNLY